MYKERAMRQAQATRRKQSVQSAGKQSKKAQAGGETRVARELPGEAQREWFVG